MSSNQKFNNMDQIQRNEILATIAKEISAIQKEHSLSLDTLRQNMITHDYEGLTLNHYNPKISKLQNELSILKSKLNNKELNQAKKIGNLIDEYSLNFEEIILQINLAMNSIKLKYEIQKENNFQSIDEIEKIQKEIITLKNQFKDSWFSNLNKISGDLSLVVSKANSRVLKKVTPYVESILADTIITDLLSNDIVIKKYISTCNEKLVAKYKELENLFYYLEEMKATNIVYEQELAAATKKEELENIDNPPFVISSTSNNSNDKIASEIKDIKDTIENELSEIQKSNLEQENKWQIFLENERAKHEKLVEQIRDDYHNSLLNEQRNMINQINNAIHEQSQEVIEKELSVDQDDLDTLYSKISKEHQEIFDENLKNKQKLLEREVANLNNSVESRINNKLEELNNEQKELMNKKSSYLEELKNKINLIRKTTLRQHIDDSVFDNNLINKINAIQEKIKSSPYNQSLNEYVYSDPTFTDFEKESIKQELYQTPNKELLNKLTNEITDRILDRFNSEVEKIRLQNSSLNNLNLMPMNLNSGINQMPSQMQMPLMFDSQYLSQMQWPEQPSIDFNNNFDDLNNNPLFNSPINFDTLNPQQSEEQQKSEEPETKIRKVKFVSADNQESRFGRLSSEDIRKYANSIISVNRKKILKSN